MKPVRTSRNQRLQGQLLVLLAAMLWGTTGTTQALAPHGATPAVIGTVRLALGGLVLLAFALVRGSLRSNRRWPLLATLSAAFFQAAYQVFFFGGVARTGVAVGTIVGIGSSPILGGLLGYLGRGERLSSRWILATLLAILGCSLLILTGAEIKIDLPGILLAIAAGGSYAAFTLASKGLVEERPPDAVIAVVFCLGALMLSPVFFISDLNWMFQPKGVLVALHLGLITVAVAYMLFAHGLVKVPVATAVSLTLAEPLTAGTLGIVVLGEHLTPQSFLGILLIFGGLALITLSRSPSVTLGEPQG
jgi:DME family drug/metabolite transporter